MTKTIRDEVCFGPDYRGWSVDEFTTAVKDAIAKVPGNASNVTVRLRGGGEDEQEIVIRWDRPETPDERASRLESEKQYAELRKSADLALYELLKKRFEKRDGGA